jgi:hypothetical protein
MISGLIAYKVIAKSWITVSGCVSITVCATIRFYMVLEYLCENDKKTLTDHDNVI